MDVPVFLVGWEIDCCVATPSVGDPVRWSLAWHDDPDHPAASVIRWTTEQPLRLDPDERRHLGVESGHLLTWGPVSAWWKGPGGRALPLTGVLVAAAHGDVPAQVPPTRGRAREVSLVIETVREDGRGRWEGVPDGTSTWPVADGRSWNDWEDFAALAGPLPARHDRRPLGVLVVVDVTV